MNTRFRQMQDVSGLRAGAGKARDFVAVDDSGDFSYYRSEEGLVASFEYVQEAACIIDRSANAYRLVQDSNRRVGLGPAVGPVEFHWLRHAWLKAQNSHPKQHRLRRHYPGTSQEVVRDLFEVLVLERGWESAPGTWSLDIDGFASSVAGMEQLDCRLVRQKLPEHVHVKDPFGHVYRPVRHRKHWYLPPGAGSILYIEVPAPIASN